MSLHLIECVRPLKLGASAKLALMAFADSANAQTNIAFPGLEAVMEWSNLGRSQAQALVSDLERQGYLKKHRGGHRGRRAEYVVFPEGCCDAHPRPAADSTSPASVADLAAALGVNLEDLAPAQRAALEQLAHQQEKGPVDRTQTAEKASGGLDSSGGNASGQPDPFDSPAAERVRPTGTSTHKGAGKGPAHRTPSPTTTTSPPTPHASGAGGATIHEPTGPACPAHHPNVADNCRGCGTTPRQLRQAAERAQRIAARADVPRCPEGTPWSADGSCGCPPPVTHPTRDVLEAQAVAS